MKTNDKPKTIRDWLETLPDGIRERAFYNAGRYPFIKSDVMDIECEDLDLAIADSFIWDETDEGYDYWESVYHGDYTQTPERDGKEK